MSEMMLVGNIFQELGFRAKESFNCMMDGTLEVSVFPFTSDNYLSQAYLIVEMREDALGHILGVGNMSSIAGAFRDQECYQSDMAKNTSLLILNMCQDKDNRRSPEKVKIEDDPLYFKKYVLSYTTIEDAKMSEYFATQKEQQGKGFSCIAMIQEYIWNISFFSAYKTNHLNEPVYTLFSETVTKLPIMPLASSGTQTLKQVDAFLQENLKVAEKKRSPVIVDTNMLDALLRDIPDWKDADAESIVERYNAISEASAKGDEN